MNLNHMKKLATVSAVALGVAAAGPAWAANYDLDSGTPIAITVGATVDNTVSVTVANNMNFQNIGVTSDAADTATLVMAPDGSITDDVAGAARMISDDSTGQQAQIEVDNAFPTAVIHVTYTIASNLIEDAADPDLVLSNILDNLDAPAKGTGGTAGTTATEGTATTTAGGELDFAIGASLSTQSTALAYDSNAYTGGFNMYMAY